MFGLVSCSCLVVDVLCHNLYTGNFQDICKCHFLTSSPPLGMVTSALLSCKGGHILIENISLILAAALRVDQKAAAPEPACGSSTIGAKLIKQKYTSV